jgi:hypothetical protein
VEIVHARCCGLDVHKKSVVACVLISQPNGLIERHVRTFKTIVPGRANVYTGGRMNVVGGGQKWQSPVAS